MQERKIVYVEIDSRCLLEVWQNGRFVIGFEGKEDSLKKVKEAIPEISVLHSSAIQSMLMPEPKTDGWIRNLFEGESANLKESLFEERNDGEISENE